MGHGLNKISAAKTFTQDCSVEVQQRHILKTVQLNSISICPEKNRNLIIIVTRVGNPISTKLRRIGKPLSIRRGLWRTTTQLKNKNDLQLWLMTRCGVKDSANSKKTYIFNKITQPAGYMLMYCMTSSARGFKRFYITDKLQLKIQ